MTLEQLTILNTVVEEGSFRAAADKLWKTQPAVSISIAKLEEELGLQIFERGHRKTVLTDAGKRIYEQAARALSSTQQIKELSQYLKEENEAEINIVIDTICPLKTLLPRLKNFFDEYPHTLLNLSFEVLSGTMERLKNEEADIIISNLGGEDFPCERIPLWDVSMTHVCSPDFLHLDKYKRIAPEELQKHPQIVIPETSAERNNNQSLLPGGRRFYVSEIEIKKEMILAGLGWGGLPEHKIKKELDDGRLIAFNTDHLQTASIPFYAIRRSDKYHGPVVSALWEQLQTLPQV